MISKIIALIVSICTALYDNRKYITRFIKWILSLFGKVKSYVSNKKVRTMKHGKTCNKRAGHNKANKRMAKKKG